MDHVLGKNTKHRKILLEVLREIDKPLSVDEIYNNMLLNGSETIALSTIYRNINSMVESSQIIKTFDDNGIALYQLNNHNHNHEIECQKCHKKIVLDICPYDLVQNTVLRNTGFTIIDNNNLLKGYCEKCLSKN